MQTSYYDTLVCIFHLFFIMMRSLFLSVALSLVSICVSAQSQQEWRDSISALSAMIERHPTDVGLRLRKAAYNIELGQWRYALDEYSNVLDMEPTNLTALYYRGFVNQHLGRYAFARQDYEAVLKLEPLDRHALMGLIYANMADKRMTQAFDDANRLVQQAPDDAEVYAVRAEVEKLLGMSAAALEDIEKAVAIEDVRVRQKYPTSVDDNITSYQLTAFELYMQLGNRRKAAKCLDYLVENGLPRVHLDEYYKLLKEK